VITTMNDFIPARARVGLGCVALGAVLLAAVQAPAISGTTQVAWPGRPVRAEADWPAGVLELVNDPLRAAGWNPWFSEWPNDVNHYEFKVRGTDDVNHLLERLAAIRGARAQVRLNPGQEARALAFTTVLNEGSGTAVVFRIGSQQRINEWYERLPEAEPGVRKFGVHRYTNAPTATPPTLTLYVGHETIDLAQLKIPAAVDVVADRTPSQRARQPDENLFQAIDDLAARHKAASTRAADPQPGPNSK
jgi:hypothetical protein